MKNLDHYHQKDFKDIVYFYLVKAAINVMAEEDIIPYHNKRVKFANKILCGNFPIEAYTIGVLTNVTIKNHIDLKTDYNNDIEFVVNSLFNAYAGTAVEE